MERQNIAFGKKVEITNLVPIANSYAAVEKGRKDILTNGIIGDPSSCYNGEWVHFYRGMGRSLTVDLGDFYAVSGFSLGFIHDKKMGIYSPENVRMYLSENGNDYYLATIVESPYPASFDMQIRAVYEKTLDKVCRARYVKLDFEVEVNVFCDELCIFGSKSDGYEFKPSGTLRTELNKNCFAPRDTLDVCDIPLLYWGYYPEDERVARLRKEDYLPFIAYIDRDGKPIDTMFDALMFLNVQGRCPSGGSLGYHGPRSILSDWEFLLDEMFLDGFNLKALDEAVADLKKTLSLDSEYKLKFYLTAPVPKISSEPFGDMNGDGIEDKILSTEDCINAYAWYVDQVTRRFNAEHFENIALDGWFWNNESASRASRDDEAVFAKGCMDKLHERGYKCIFIPYFQAGGCEKVDDIGFDCTTMQPGLSFQEVLGRDPKGMFADFTDLCKKYGFGVELEIHQGVKNPDTMKKYIELFDQYLIGCMRNGMMTDTVHTYYQVAGPGVFHFCAYAKLDEQRAVYDKLYKFIKGTLSESDFIVKDIDEIIEEIVEEVTNETVEEEIVETVEEPIVDEAEAITETEDGEPEQVVENAVIPDIAEEEKESSIPEPESKKAVVEPETESESVSATEPDDDDVFDFGIDEEKIAERRQKLKKMALVGAGVAAVLGITYLVLKGRKDK